MQATCPHCQQALKVAEKHVGKQIRCPSCSTPFVCDAPEESAFDLLAEQAERAPITETVLSRRSAEESERPRLTHPATMLSGLIYIAAGLTMVCGIVGCLAIPNEPAYRTIKLFGWYPSVVAGLFMAAQALVIDLLCHIRDQMRSGE